MRRKIDTATMAFHNARRQRVRLANPCLFSGFFHSLVKEMVVDATCRMRIPSLVLWAVVGMCVSDVRGQDPRPSVAEIRRGVVYIKSFIPNVGTGVGTGFLVDKTGVIYTNRHVIESGNRSHRDSVIMVGVPSRDDLERLDYFPRRYCRADAAATGGMGPLRGNDQPGAKGSQHFVSGEVVASGKLKHDRDNLVCWVFGHDSDPRNHRDQFVGLLDDLRVYCRILSQAGVQRLAGVVEIAQ